MIIYERRVQTNCEYQSGFWREPKTKAWMESLWENHVSKWCQRYAVARNICKRNLCKFRSHFVGTNRSVNSNLRGTKSCNSLQRTWLVHYDKECKNKRCLLARTVHKNLADLLEMDTDRYINEFLDLRWAIWDTIYRMHLLLATSNSSYFLAMTFWISWITDNFINHQYTLSGAWVKLL